jgi:transposase
MFLITKKAVAVLPKQFADLGDLVAIDGSLIDAVLSMAWADYRKKSKKAKLHLGFNISHSIPQKLLLTNGNGAERPFVEQILEPGQTGIMDRGYKNHNNFDQLQQQGMHFVCRIKGHTTKTCLKEFPVKKDSIIFYDAIVLLGQAGINETKRELRLVGYHVGSKKIWVTTDRFDLTAEQIALIYELRWNIEKFFAWWKRHFRVYHLITRSKHGLMVQILSGLITYLLLAIYCHE